MAIIAKLLGCFKNKVHHHTDNNNVALDQEQEESMYAFYKRIETQNQLSTDFLSFQPQVSVYVRNSLVDWLTSLHFSLDLLQPTLFLAVNIVDRFLSVEVVSSEHDLKQVAIVALVIACKFEENWSPTALTLMEEDEDGYSQQQIDAIEKNILQKLGWKLLVPTIHSFLVEIFESCEYRDQEFKDMAFFFGEVALNNYHATISYSPSTLAVSAIYAAMCVLKKSEDDSKQKFLNTNQSHSKGEITFCAGMLQRLARMAPTGKLMIALAEKYSDQILILHSKK